MKSAFRFRLYPNRKQEQKLLKMIEAGRQLWNDALAHRKRRWEEERLSTSYSQQCWILTAERQADLLLGELYSQAGQETLKRLDGAFRGFFEGRTRYPKFKKFTSPGSFTYPQAYNGSVKPDVARKRLFLSKVGNVKAVFHRPVPAGAMPKTCTIVREPDGEWYASLVYEDGGALKPRTSFTSPLGIDLGLKSLIATTEGTKVLHPKFLRKAEKRLKHLQWGLSRMQKGSTNRGKARRLLAVQHAKVANQRKDFNHKLSAGLVRRHDLVAFEDLKVRNMVKNHALAKSISDAGWSQLVAFCQYKEERRGGLVVRVQPAYSTQECFFCGALNPIPLSVREFGCRGCGRALDRDLNAAKITLKRGLAQVGQDMPELKPVETGPIPVPTTGRASLVGEAGTICGENHATQQEFAAGSPRLKVVGGCHENGRRYWSAFQLAWDKYPLELIFSSFFFAEIGAQLIFREVGERSTNKVYSTAFKSITRDESRHLTGTLAMLETLAGTMNGEQKATISRQMKHGFIYLSPLLFRPIPDFWKLPKDFMETDQKLEGLAAKSGLGVPKIEERSLAWMNAIQRHRPRLDELGILTPEIKEIGLEGFKVDVKKGDEIIATPF